MSCITSLNTTSYDVVFSTYIGGRGDDYGLSIFANNDTSFSISGQTNSNNFPISDDAIMKEYCNALDGFILKMTVNGKVKFYILHILVGVNMI